MNEGILEIFLGQPIQLTPELFEAQERILILGTREFFETYWLILTLKIPHD